MCVAPQVGFTAEGPDARSSTYASDICKMIRAPVLHVNAENLEHVVKAATCVCVPTPVVCFPPCDLRLPAGARGAGM